MSVYLCYKVGWDLEDASMRERKRMTSMTIAAFEVDENEDIGMALGDKLTDASGYCVVDFSYVKVAKDDECRFWIQWESNSHDA